MRGAGARILLLLGVLVVLVSGSDAGALSLTTTANLLTAPPPNGPNDPPNCNLRAAGGPTTCTTAAGTATAVADLWSLGGLASTVGTAASSLHRAAAGASFSEDVTVPGAPASSTLLATFQLSGAITPAVGATGFVQLSFDAGASVLSASNGNILSLRQVQWDFDASSPGAFSESTVVQWDLTGGSIPALSAMMSVSVNNTGLVLDFLNTFELDQLEAFDGSGSPIALELFDSGGGLIGSTVPEPASAMLFAIGLLGLCGHARHRPTH